MSTPSTTADDILRCARALIVRGGYNAFSYADVAEAVGIRKASIHHHFPAKADLVRVLVAGYRREAEEGVAELQRRIVDPAAQLRAYIGFWGACISDRSFPICVCALLASEIEVLPEPVALEVRGYFRWLSAWLASILARGAAQDRLTLASTAESEAETFMATVHGAMLSARAYGDAAAFEAVTRPLLQRLGA